MTRLKNSCLALGAAAILALSAAAALADSSLADRNLAPGRVVPPAPQARDGGLFQAIPGETEDVFAYPSDDSTVVASVGFIDDDEIGFFFSATRGDSVTETFVGPPSITSYDLDVDVVSNVLNSGGFVDWDVLINGIVVDRFTVNEGFLGTVSQTATFHRIDGPAYTVELRVANEVEVGDGSHSLRYAGIGLHQLELEGGLALAVTGACPGEVSVALEGATPFGTIALAQSRTPGLFRLRGGPCVGTPLGLASPQPLVELTADFRGSASFTADVPALACGRFLQAIDLRTCDTSNVASLP